MNRLCSSVRYDVDQRSVRAADQRGRRNRVAPIVRYAAGMNRHANVAAGLQSIVRILHDRLDHGRVRCRIGDGLDGRHSPMNEFAGGQRDIDRVTQADFLQIGLRDVGLHAQLVEHGNLRNRRSRLDVGSGIHQAFDDDCVVGRNDGPVGRQDRLRLRLVLRLAVLRSRLTYGCGCIRRLDDGVSQVSLRRRSLRDFVLVVLLRNSAFA